MTAIDLDALSCVHGGQNVLGFVIRTMASHYAQSGRTVATTLGRQYDAFGRAIVAAYRR